MVQLLETIPEWNTKTCLAYTVNSMAADDLGPLLLTWFNFNFNPSMDN